MASPSSSFTHRPPVALIAGPTASGKSALAVALAQALGDAEVVNADASQVYVDIPLLSARPDAAEMAGIPHRLFGHVDGGSAHNAARWAEEARRTLSHAHAAGKVPILVGGTGLYLRTLLDGIAPVPEIDPEIREAVRALPVADAYELENIAITFRKPFLDLNMVPLLGLKITSKKTILCLKIHKNHNNKKLSLNEMFRYGLVRSDRSEDFKRKKIKLHELNRSQIKDIVLEMIKLISNSWKIKDRNDLKLQKKFRKLFLSRINQIDPEFRYKFNALYSLSFLRRNPWFLK